jgi:hypothetical protein
MARGGGFARFYAIDLASNICDGKGVDEIQCRDESVAGRSSLAGQKSEGQEKGDEDRATAGREPIRHPPEPTAEKCRVRIHPEPP